MRFFLNRRVSNFKIRMRSYVEFTFLQLLQHNVQLGAAAAFSLLSSHWFLYGIRHKFTIIDLSQTIVSFRYFLNVVNQIVHARRHTLFVNERHYAATVTRDVAQSVGEAYVMGRWIGGTLTNFKSIWKMYKRVFRKPNVTNFSPSQLILKKTLRGLVVLKSLPAAVFFNSAKSNISGSRETYALHIPAAALTDTDSYPASLLYPVPGNDDAFGSVLFANQLIAKSLLIAKMRNMVGVYKKFCERLRRQELRFLRLKATKEGRVRRKFRQLPNNKYRQAYFSRRS